MIIRTYDSKAVDEATKEFQYDFDPVEWVEDERNIALLNEYGDMNLFQFQTEGTYIGHFFYQSRGKQALESAKKMLRYIFSLPSVDVIIGLTPVEKLGAKWLTRKLGFKSYGEVETLPGLCELFIMTKAEYEQKEEA